MFLARLAPMSALSCFLDDRPSTYLSMLAMMLLQSSGWRTHSEVGRNP